MIHINFFMLTCGPLSVPFHTLTLPAYSLIFLWAREEQLSGLGPREKDA